MPDASPAKWHLAHTTWFFETFLLRDHVPGYRAYDDGFAYLFNSYYEGEGDRHPRARRGHDLAAVARRGPRLARRRRCGAGRCRSTTLPADLIQLGLNHEQQHQELMLMDLTATFAENPLHPGDLAGRAARARPRWQRRSAGSRARRAWSRSAMTAPASPSIARGRATRRSCIHMRLPTAPSPMPNGSASSPTAAMPILCSGFPTAGPGCARTGSRRRSTGCAARRAGPASASTASIRSISPSRFATSPITRPTPLPAGPARGCRPRRNGRAPRRA